MYLSTVPRKYEKASWFRTHFDYWVYEPEQQVSPSQVQPRMDGRLHTDHHEVAVVIDNKLA